MRCRLNKGDNLTAYNSLTSEQSISTQIAQRKVNQQKIEVQPTHLLCFCQCCTSVNSVGKDEM